MPGAALALAASLLYFYGNTFAEISEPLPAPVIDTRASSYDPAESRLILKGANFQPGTTVVLKKASTEILPWRVFVVVQFLLNRRIVLRGASRDIRHGPVEVVDSRNMIVSNVEPADMKEGVEATALNPEGEASLSVNIALPLADDRLLTENDVKTIIAQAVAEAEARGLRASIAVVDKEANVLGVFNMEGYTRTTQISAGRSPAGGLEGLTVPSEFAAITKAATGAFLSSQGHSFTTRTASFIVQQHFPPGVDFMPGGPLFGVQFSQLPCGDINPAVPLGLSADPGGVALYKNGNLAGGIGIEGDGVYTFDRDPTDDDFSTEEAAALAGTREYETPSEIRGDQIIVNGIRFPFTNGAPPTTTEVRSFDQLRGGIHPLFPIRNALPSRFQRVAIDGLEGRVDTRFFPFKSGSFLTEEEVRRIIVQAARQASITRAAIRRPLGSAAEVNIAVTDVDGTVLGIFSTPDAPMFGLDVCVQKGRTAAFLSGASAGAQLQTAGGGKFASYVDAAARDGLRLDGSVALTDRAAGFLSRPFFPDGIDGTQQGPFSKPIAEFSPFNDGLQLDLVTTALARVLAGESVKSCTAIPGLANGLQIFPGSVPLYKGNQLVGAIGVSGDGVDQDDIVAAMGSAGFEAPAQIRSDTVFVRGVRLPYVKFPRHPNN